MLARVALEGEAWWGVEAWWEDETAAASVFGPGACSGGGTLGDCEEASPELG